MANRFISPAYTPQDALGRSLPGAQLFTYEPTTTTDKFTYADEDLTTPNANPVVADGDGVFADIYLDGSYRMILQDKDGNEIWDRDNVKSIPAAGASTLEFGYLDEAKATDLTGVQFIYVHSELENPTDPENGRHFHADGTSGTPSTGDINKFFDSAGNGWAADDDQRVSRKRGMSEYDANVTYAYGGKVFHEYGSKIGYWRCINPAGSSQEPGSGFDSSASRANENDWAFDETQNNYNRIFTMGSQVAITQGTGGTLSEGAFSAGSKGFGAEDFICFYSVGTTTQYLALYTYEGTTLALEASSNITANFGAPTYYFGQDGTGPYIVTLDGTNIRVREFTVGVGWANVGSALAVGGTASFCVLDFQSDGSEGTIVVSDGTDLTVYEWDGSAFSSAGNALADTSEVYDSPAKNIFRTTTGEYYWDGTDITAYPDQTGTVNIDCRHICLTRFDIMNDTPSFGGPEIYRWDGKGYYQDEILAGFTDYDVVVGVLNEGIYVGLDGTNMRVMGITVGAGNQPYLSRIKR